MNHNTIIIGAGPAGIAAAIQLKRAGHDFIILEKGPIGGLLNNANLVENYPGFAGGLPGTQLVERLRQHIDSLKIEVLSEQVLSVENESNKFTVKTEDTEYNCQNLVVASGTKAKKFSEAQYEKNIADRIHYKVYHLKDVDNKEITIIGGGDAAFDYALSLTGNRVSIFYREPKCLPLLYKRVCKSEHTKLFPKTEVAKIEDCCDKLKIITTNQYHKIHHTDFVVAAIGREPNIDFLAKNIRNDFLEKRRIKGLYYSGDVAHGFKRQVAIAVGDGLNTAMDILKKAAK